MLIVLAVVVLAYFVLKGKGQGFDMQPGSFQFDLSLATPQMWALFNAIKSAENSDPSHNNPLDITPPGWTGPTFGAGIAAFDSPATGTARGMFEIWLIATGKSTVYSLADTIATMAAKWTTTDQSGWARNVGLALGVSPDTPLSQVLGRSYSVDLVQCTEVA